MCRNIPYKTNHRLFYTGCPLFLLRLFLRVFLNAAIDPVPQEIRDGEVEQHRNQLAQQILQALPQRVQQLMVEQVHRHVLHDQSQTERRRIRRRAHGGMLDAEGVARRQMVMHEAAQNQAHRVGHDDSLRQQLQNHPAEQHFAERRHKTAQQIHDQLTVGSFFGSNLLPVTIGNIIGGGVIVGIGLYIINKPKKTEE